MRSFIAVNFSESVKDKLTDTVGQLRKSCLSGSFIGRENMHLTLVFLGELDIAQVDAVKQLMDRVTVPRFDLTIEGVGRFDRREGDIYWLGIKDSGPLNELQRNLSDGLRAEGFAIENRRFKPHITLGRRVRPAPGFNIGVFGRKTPKVNVHVNRYSLMSSELRDGRRVYTEVYGKELDRA